MCNIYIFPVCVISCNLRLNVVIGKLATYYRIYKQHAES